MVIYVEYALIDNLIINSLLLNLTNKFLKLESRKLLIFLSALIGTIVALITPMLPQFFSYISKLLLAIIMPLIINRIKSLKKTISSIIVFLFLTMLFMGFCIFICYTFNIEFITDSNGNLVYNFPIGLSVFLCCFAYYIIKNLIKLFYNKKHINNFTYDVILFNNNIVYKTKAFLDSGNFLCDTQLNKPICLINLTVFNNLYPNVNLSSLLLKKIDALPVKNAKYLNVNSIGKNKEILVFEIEKMKILLKNNKNNEKNEQILTFNNILLGLTLKNFANNLNADCILNYEYMC